MKFLCLGYYDEKKFAGLSKEQVRAIVKDCPEHDARLYEGGRVEMVASLGPSSASRSIRPRNGKPVVTDGPFAEAKEQVGSFFIIEAADMEEAVVEASKHPAAHLGESVGWGVEVRPIGMCRGKQV